MSEFVVSITLFCLASFASLTAAAEEVGTHIDGIEAHQHLQARCDRCHDDNVDVSQLAQTSDAHCGQCHEPKQAGKFLKVGLREDEAPESASSADSPPATVGMRYRLYYEESRYGDAPGEMVLIPAGEFIMGTNERLPDEGPQHKVHLDSFLIDKYEVTNLQYRRFIHETKRRSPKHFRNRTYPDGKVDHPVTFVNWYDARDYCAWAGKRLPTDQEWEKAARGTDGRTYAWGNEFSIEKANTPQRWGKIGQMGDTTPVGSFEQGISPYGLYDVSGNVWEWTASWYKAYPGNATASENYGERYMTLKGGSWFDCSFYRCGISAPVFNRAFFARKVRNDTFGFRCAKDVEE